MDAYPENDVTQKDAGSAPGGKRPRGWLARWVPRVAGLLCLACFAGLNLMPFTEYGFLTYGMHEERGFPYPAYRRELGIQAFTGFVPQPPVGRFAPRWNQAAIWKNAFLAVGTALLLAGGLRWLIGRRFLLSVKTALVLLTLIACLCGWLRWRYTRWHRDNEIADSFNGPNPKSFDQLFSQSNVWHAYLEPRESNELLWSNWYQKYFGESLDWLTCDLWSANVYKSELDPGSLQLLGKLTGVRHLEIYGEYGTRKVVEPPKELAPQLESLRLDYCTVDFATWSVLPRLTTMGFSSCNIPTECTDLALRLPALEELEWQYSDAWGSSAISIEEQNGLLSLLKLPRIRRLSIGYQRYLGAHEFSIPEEVLNAVLAMPQLEELTIDSATLPLDFHSRLAQKRGVRVASFTQTVKNNAITLLMQSQSLEKLTMLLPEADAEMLAAIGQCATLKSLYFDEPWDEMPVDAEEATLELFRSALPNLEIERYYLYRGHNSRDLCW